MGEVGQGTLSIAPCPTCSSWHALSRSTVGAGEASEVPEGVTAGQGPLMVKGNKHSGLCGEG